MCVVSVKVNEATLREVSPRFNSTKAIGEWVQHLVDVAVRELAAEDTMSIEEAKEMTLKTVKKEYATERAAARREALKRDMTPEQLYAVISEEIDDIYARS